MATRRRIKPVLNLANIRKPVKDEKSTENVPVIKIDNDENDFFFKLPPQDPETSLSSKEKDISHIEVGCQSPTKLKHRPNVNPVATTPILTSVDLDIRTTPASGYNRIRTESVSSTKSSVFNFYNRDRKDSHRIRQISRCEEKEKVVESKREIKSRYANADKMRLTMFDMIYYNPTGNPMQKKSTTRPIEDNITRDVSKVPVNSSSTKEDVKTELSKPKVEEMSTVPQLKLGPNGEIILDEKSLTIENLKEKEAREQIANSKIQYDDEYSNNYGYYKRQKRTKDWPADETIKFYKCLHTVGTDFSLMLALFPKRSRRDLKLKYKKEERHNPGLVNKALLHPKRFNIEELEEELKEEEVTKKEIAAKEELHAQQEKANRAKRSTQIENTKIKMPQRKVSKVMRMMTDGNEVYGSNRSVKARKRKSAAPKIPTPTVEQYKEPEICLPIIANPAVSFQPPVPKNDGYCSNPSFEENKQILYEAPIQIIQEPVSFQVTDNMELEQVDSKIDINNEIGYLTDYESYNYPLSPNAVDEALKIMPPPSSHTPSRLLPSASPARSMPSQSPRSVENNPLNNLSELELDSLVLVESQDPNSKNTHFEVYIMEENGEISEKPLELSPDVIESIRQAMMNDS